jgi:hypothetical protein
MLKPLLFIISITSTFISYGQFHDKCGTHLAIDYQESLTPGFKNQVEQQFQIAKNSLAKTNQLYTVPVVVHIVHNTADQNLADSVIYLQIQTLNEDYQRLNPDTVNMRSDFDIVKGNPRIEFRLATIDPAGNPTTGITRTQTSTASFGSFNFILGDFSDLEKVKQTAQGGHDPWDQSRYLNIWVCNMELFGFPVILGYATPPSGLPNWPPGSNLGLSDGVVIQYQAFGSNNPNPIDLGEGPLDIQGRTLTHEVGHYLGLRHIWGDGNCTQEDGIDDTPNADAQSDFDCNPTKNTCVDNIYGVDLPDMIENYMDYSAETCQNSFTQGQVDLMRGVLENQRIDLIQNNPAFLPDFNQISFALFPNPTNSDITVRIDSGIANRLVLFDLKGTILLEQEITESQIKLYTEQLDSGVYTLVLYTNNGMTSTKRIVKI